MSKRRRVALPCVGHEIWRLVSWSAFLPYQDIISLRQSFSGTYHEARVVLTKKIHLSTQFLRSLRQSCFLVLRLQISNLIFDTLRPWIPYLLKIQELTLRSCAMENLRGLKQCQNLEVLKLYFCETTKTKLPKLPPKLKTLIVFSSKLQTITTLTQCPALQNLDLSFCDLQEVGPIQSLRNLEKLDLQSCQSIRDVSWLKGCPRLKKLGLEGCKNLTDISDVPPSVSYLDIQNCGNIEDLAVFRKLSNLQTLCTQGPHRHDFQSCRKLTTLILTEDPSIQDLDFLQDVPQLRCLLLQNCRRLKNLQRLSTYCPSLIMLDISGCHLLEDLSEIRQCRSLQALMMEECPLISDLTPTTHIHFVKT